METSNYKIFLSVLLVNVYCIVLCQSEGQISECNANGHCTNWVGDVYFEKADAMREFTVKIGLHEGSKGKTLNINGEEKSGIGYVYGVLNSRVDQQDQLLDNFGPLWTRKLDDSEEWNIFENIPGYKTNDLQGAHYGFFIPIMPSLTQSSIDLSLKIFVHCSKKTGSCVNEFNALSLTMKGVLPPHDMQGFTFDGTINGVNIDLENNNLKFDYEYGTHGLSQVETLDSFIESKSYVLVILYEAADRTTQNSLVRPILGKFKLESFGTDDPKKSLRKFEFGLDLDIYFKKKQIQFLEKYSQQEESLYNDWSSNNGLKIAFTVCKPIPEGANEKTFEPQCFEYLHKVVEGINGLDKP